VETRLAGLWVISKFRRWISFSHLRFWISFYLLFSYDLVALIL